MLHGINRSFRSKTLCRIGHERKTIFFLFFFFFVFELVKYNSPNTSHNIMEDLLVARNFLFRLTNTQL